MSEAAGGQRLVRREMSAGQPPQGLRGPAIGPEQARIPGRRQRRIKIE